jgi:fucose permease
MAGLSQMTAATIGGALIFGMALALLGRLKLAVARSVTAEDGAIRRWLLALNIALIPLVLLSGVLVDAYGARPILIVGSATLAVALVCLSLRPTYPHAFASMLLAGLGASALGASSTVMMPRAFFVTEETSAALNLGYVFIALGALLTPVLADILLEKVELRRTLAVLALLSLIPAFLGVLPSKDQWQISVETDHSSGLLAEPSCWLAALVVFFYAPLEAAISLWAFALLAERGQDEREATGLLSGFWAAFMGSRLIVTLAQHLDIMSDWWDRTLIVAPTLLAAVLLGNLAGASHRAKPRLGLMLLGLLLGPVLPTLIGTIFRLVPTERGAAYGLMFAAGSLGSVVLAPFAKLRSHPPLHAALRLPILLALLVTATALVLGLISGS